MRRRLLALAAAFAAVLAIATPARAAAGAEIVEDPGLCLHSRYLPRSYCIFIDGRS